MKRFVLSRRVGCHFARVNVGAASLSPVVAMAQASPFDTGANSLVDLSLIHI